MLYKPEGNFPQLTPTNHTLTSHIPAALKSCTAGIHRNTSPDFQKHLQDVLHP